MSDALDGLVPEDAIPNAGPTKGSGGYRHDAEGSDDMPVCSSPILLHAFDFHN